MADSRDRRKREIQDNLFRLDNLNPFFIPPGDVLRPFINELLKNMVAEANDLKEEKSFRESAILLHQYLLVYVQHIVPLGLELPEDKKQVLEIRMFKAKMSVFAGIFQWAIEEANYVANVADFQDQYTERRKEAQLIVTVAKAGLDLLKYRDKGIGKIELKRQQRILHRLNGTGQEAMLNLMIQELDKDLGPYQESAEAEVNKTEALDLAWIPEGVKKHQEKVEANKTKMQELIQYNECNIKMRYNLLRNIHRDYHNKSRDPRPIRVMALMTSNQLRYICLAPHHPSTKQLGISSRQQTSVTPIQHHSSQRHLLSHQLKPWVVPHHPAPSNWVSAADSKLQSHPFNTTAASATSYRTNSNPGSSHTTPAPSNWVSAADSKLHSHPFTTTASSATSYRTNSNPNEE
ncbi:hypothetical protein BSL78_05248 [Apostichopus japonicus]|uniref:Uncharacterized protein n=1 Tax=Stichopus japonicus TaxID=307972 RepID=A0A2G8LCD1_STIJA|nr:hypothetical protein BSL78_05248 [Apostichopus japonicus]